MFTDPSLWESYFWLTRRLSFQKYVLQSFLILRKQIWTNKKAEIHTPASSLFNISFTLNERKNIRYIHIYTHVYVFFIIINESTSYERFIIIILLLIILIIIWCYKKVNFCLYMLLDGSESGSETDRERERKIDREKERDSHGGDIVSARGFCLVIKIWILFCNRASNSF